MRKISGNNTLALLGQSGQLEDSKITLDNLAKYLTESGMGSIVPVKANSLPALDANGRLIDSGYGVDNLAPASATVLWTSSKIETDFMKKLKGFIEM